MGKNSGTTMASFFKILIGHDFTSQLRLPPQFVKDHGGRLSEKVKLFTASGDSPWIVRTEEIGPYRFLTDGWAGFSRDADLKAMDFLVFRLVGDSEFEVSVYDASACQKGLPPCPDVEDDGGDGRGDDVGDRKRWKFIQKLSEQHTSELKIPREFAMGSGIVENRKVKLRLGKGGRYWSIHVTSKQHGVLAMRGGWNEFLIDNNVFVESTLSFVFIGGSGNVIEANVVKNNSKGELFTSAKRSRGRPPKLN